MSKPDALPSDRTLELRIIRAAFDLARGTPNLMTTMHDIRAATAELARRHPKGYPLAESDGSPWPWEAAPPAPLPVRRADARRPTR